MIKKNYFFRLSTLALIVSVAALTVESICEAEESEIALAESTAAFNVAESTVVSADSAALLQAAKEAAITRTANTFFM
jgi:hypothetical protein